MSQLFIKEFKTKKPVTLSDAMNLLETQTVMNTIKILNWKDFGYLPKVNFRIGHSENEIWLKYYVNEKNLRAIETKTNGNIYKDSCVEFFISPGEENYYNFEFSCIGTTHLAWGPGRHNRKFVDPVIIKKLEIESSLGDQPFGEKTGNFNWELMIRIPLECFAFSNLSTFKGLKAKANFFKCGDETLEPHFVTWNPVKTTSPDYHRPEFFGEVLFK
jgi:hypothetical protein